MVVYVREIRVPAEVIVDNINIHTGAYLMGEEVITYQNWHEIPMLRQEDVVCDYINETKQLLRAMGIEVKTYDYPEELKAFYGREIRQAVMGDIVNIPDNWGHFVKPLAASKAFVGRVVNGTKDLIGIGLPMDYPIWMSEAVEFLAEWRCFVLDGEVIDVRPYKGDYHYTYDPAVIDAAVAAWKDAPIAYALDIGVTSDQRTLIVEVNDGFALGQYGLNAFLAFKFHRARWHELTQPYFAEHEIWIREEES